MKKSLENKLQKQRQSHLKMRLKKSPKLAVLFIYAAAFLTILGFAACGDSNSSDEASPSGEPSFTYPEDKTDYMFRVRHSLAVGDTVGRVEAAAPSGASITYSLDSNEDSAFAIGESSGVINAAAGLMTKTYTLSVVAANSTDTNLSSTASVSVEVVSAEPNFDSPSYTFPIPSLPASGAAIGRVSAPIPFWDPVSYAFASNGNPGDFFAIDESTGAITRSATVPLTDARHTLRVIATNTEVTSQIKEVEVTVEVAPAEPAFDAVSYTFSIRTPDAASGAAIGSVSAQVPFGSSVSYAFASNGNPGDFFAIDASSGAITRSAMGPFTEASHSLMVIATNTEFTSQTKEVMVAVEVVSAEPAFNAVSYTFSIRTSLAGGGSVGSVSAQVPFGDPVSYAFASTGNPGGFFAIDASSGAITRSTTGTLTGAMHTLRVIATNTEVIGQTKEVEITVSAPSETPTPDGSTRYRFSSTILLPSGGVVTSVSAPVPFGDPVSYAFDSIKLRNENDMEVPAGNVFAIDAVTGIITRSATGTLTEAIYILRVIATNTVVTSQTKTVTLRVTVCGLCIGDSFSELKSGEGNVPTLANGDNFGYSLGYLGDIDGADTGSAGVLAVGADWNSGNKGAVHLLYLNSNGGVQSSAAINGTTANGPTTLGTDNHFGSSLAWLGDIDGADTGSAGVLAVGARYANVVYLLYINADGSLTRTIKFDTGTSIGGDPTNTLSVGDGKFGKALAWLGDIDGGGDSVGVLAVGTEEGNKIYLLFLNADSSGVLSVGKSVIITKTTINSAAADSLGYSLAWLGDIDGDAMGASAGVLAVGAIGNDNQTGAVYLLYLNTDGTLEGSAKIDKNTVNGPSALASSDFFGSSLAWLGDHDGSGGSVGVLAVGAEGDVSQMRSGAGAVYLLYLNADGTLFRTFEASGADGNDAQAILPTFEAYYSFGSSLVWLGNLGGTDSTQGILSAGVAGRNNSGVVYQIPFDF